MAIRLKARKASEGDEDTLAISFAPILASGETLVAPVVVEECDSDGAVTATGDLTFSNEQVNAATVVIQVDDRTKKSVGVGKVALFDVEGMQAGTDYLVRVTVTTSTGREKVVDAEIETVSDTGF